jgi:DNA helicase-2/ATP-dependent DNA helicase PcrA
VADRVLESREAGIPLRRQAVLMRTSHHSDLLEIELVRRDIPFVKYGGLKFLEASHVKDLLCVLRFAENPRDRVAGLRVLQLLPAIGPVRARRILDELAALGHDLARLSSLEPPREARTDWPAFASLLQDLAAGVPPWPAQVERAHEWYRPHLFRIHEAADVRDRDLVQMEVIATAFPDRERFLTELTLDPPDACGDEAGPPHLDEDYLVLSTIHSAKGQEWDVVHVIHVADGCIPSDLSTGDPDQIEEERRLLYVAMTRARDELHVIHPHRFFTTKGPRRSDASVSTPLSRFLEPSLLDRFDRRAALSSADLREEAASSAGRPVIDVARRVRDLWGPVDPGSG